MRSRRRVMWWALGSTTALVVGGVLLVLAVAQLSQAPGNTTARTYGSLQQQQAMTPTSRGDATTSTVPGAAVTPTPPPGDTRNTVAAAPPLLAAVERIRIASIGVDAPVVTIGLDEHGDMDAPDGPEAVGWYDFTSKPGLREGNAVLSGHLDWRGHGPAVFAQLAALKPGDHVEIALVDGSTLRYRVTASRTYPLDQLDSREIIAPTRQPSLTLITCAGEYSSAGYDERHIVRAVLVDQDRGRPG